MQSVDFRAELRDPALARALARRLGAVDVEELAVRDTCFRVVSGRLKRREIDGRAPVYIRYDRPDRAAPRACTFEVLTPEQARAHLGRQDPPLLATVRIRRSVLRLGRCGLHIDRVDGLGDFFEAEALVGGDRSIGQCSAEVESVRDRFMPSLGEAVACSYAELVAAALPQSTADSQARPGAWRHRPPGV